MIPRKSGRSSALITTGLSSLLNSKVTSVSFKTERVSIRYFALNPISVAFP
jgi:hypothetical protein